jgi:hypothetical protein
MAADVAVVTDDTITTWAERIRGAMAKTVEAIVTTGTELVEAKAAVGHGNWLPLLDRVGMGEDTAERFMAIAGNGALLNSATLRNLPPNHTTLATLARLDPDEIIEAVETGKITPATIHVQAGDYVRSIKPPSPPNARSRLGRRKKVVKSNRNAGEPQLTTEVLEAGAERSVRKVIERRRELDASATVGETTTDNAIVYTGNVVLDANRHEMFKGHPHLRSDELVRNTVDQIVSLAEMIEGEVGTMIRPEHIDPARAPEWLKDIDKAIKELRKFRRMFADVVAQQGAR